MKTQGRPGSIVLMASMGGVAGAGFTVGFSHQQGRRGVDGQRPSPTRWDRTASESIPSAPAPSTPNSCAPHPKSHAPPRDFGKRAPLRRLGHAVQGRRHDRLARLGFV